MNSLRERSEFLTRALVSVSAMISFEHPGRHVANVLARE
jgi:hypothetical protein